MFGRGLCPAAIYMLFLGTKHQEAAMTKEHVGERGRQIDEKIDMRGSERKRTLGRGLCPAAVYLLFLGTK